MENIYVNHHIDDIMARMKPNITLIGMPCSGKSTIGIILAKFIAYGFIDTDLLIQGSQKKSLQEIINDEGLLAFRQIEAAEILKVDVKNHVIATGGSVVYGEEAMNHLKSISNIVFLQVEYPEIQKRMHNFETRGIAMEENQTLFDLYEERKKLYETYADLIFDCGRLDQEEIAEFIATTLLKS